jgi:hypothetical protein
LRFEIAQVFFIFVSIVHGNRYVRAHSVKNSVCTFGKKLNDWWCDSEMNFQYFRVTFHYFWSIHVLACASVVQLLFIFCSFFFFHDQRKRWRM